SEGLWAEVRRQGVHVTCVNPGTTKTEFFDHHERFGMRAKLLERAMTADRVAAIAIDALARGKPTVVCGAANALAVWMGRLFPRRWIARATARLMQSGK
ncbi:MAG: SDR family NAD(P)-dependent oxidoreductase, partial [Planctomycetota bacterium]